MAVRVKPWHWVAVIVAVFVLGVGAAYLIGGHEAGASAALAQAAAGLEVARRRRKWQQQRLEQRREDEQRERAAHAAAADVERAKPLTKRQADEAIERAKRW